MLTRRSGKYRGVWHSNNVDYELDLLSFISSREQGETSEKLYQDGPKRPHVNLLVVGEET
jgi:hypothetical protein